MLTQSRRVLFISYTGMLEPLGQSQVIAYLRALSDRGFNFTLLSFERDDAYTPEGIQRCAELKQALAKSNIDWHWLKYHKRPSLPATAYDVVAGVRYGKALARQNPFELVHARSHIPATIALRLKRDLGTKMIFDIRGLMADEYVDAGHWRKDSIPYRVTKVAERRAMAAADGVVTLTESIWPIIRQWDGLRTREVAHEVVPCCADLERFRFRDEARASQRKEMGVEDRIVIVYSGSIDGWYLTEKMADFFSTAHKENPNAFMLWLTQSRPERIDTLMRSRGIDNNDYTIIAAEPDQVPAYLSASDAGLAFIKPCFSKLASSPTKYAEYLGCGLPLIINAGVGDSDALVTSHRVGTLVRDFNESEYLHAVKDIEEFVKSSAETRMRTRKVAEQLFDLESVGAERYARLYERVLSGRN